MAGTLRSSAGISAAVLTSRILGVVRDSLFTAIFSATALTDAYNVAFRIPNLLRDLFAEGALSGAFVPTFAAAMADGGQERAYRLGNLVLSGILVVTGLLTLGGIAWSGEVVWLISGGFKGDAAKLAEASRLARVMMPILTLVSVSAVFMGMLNAQRRFTAPAFAPALFNLTSIGFGGALLFTSALPQTTAMLVFAAGTTVAGVVQAGCQLPSLWRLGYRPRLAFAGIARDPGVRRILRLMAPAVVGLAAVQVNVFVNTQFACALGDGPATYLNNAFRLFYLPIGLFGVALGTVTATRVSEEAARGNRAALVARTLEGGQAVWMLAAPSAIGLFLLAEPIVTMLFEHGRFDSANTRQMVPIVQAYMLGLLPYSLVKVFAPAFYTIDRARIPMVASICAVAVNVLFNAATYRSLGAPGLAIGTAIGALVNVTILRLNFRRIVGAAPRPAEGVGRGRAALALLLGNLGLGLVVWASWQGGRRLLTLPMLASSPKIAGWVSAGLLFFIIGIAFAAYVALLRRLRYPGADELGDLPRNLLARFRRR